MWGECILYMPATDTARKMSDEYFWEQKQYKERIKLEEENEMLRRKIRELSVVKE